jgi:hypothetical protein
MRNKAEKLVLKYFHIVCKLDLQDTSFDFEVIKKWTKDSGYYQHLLNSAIQCAIAETEAVIDKLERIGISTYRHKMLLAELKTLF